MWGDLIVGVDGCVFDKEQLNPTEYDEIGDDQIELKCEKMTLEFSKLIWFSITNPVLNLNSDKAFILILNLLNAYLTTLKYCRQNLDPIKHIQFERTNLHSYGN